MANLTERAYNDYNKEIGRQFGQKFNIYRPPLGTTIDQTPTLVYSNKMFKVEKTGPILAQPGIYNLEYYAVFGDFSLLQKGDILVPQQDDSDTPVITFVSKSPSEGARGFRTSRICKIGTSKYDSDVVYSNVRFDFIPIGFPRSQFDELLPGAGADPIMGAILYARPNIQTYIAAPNNNQPYDVLGMYLTETDGTNEIRWVVRLIEVIGNIAKVSVVLDR